jgi:D-methionine transport system ATP-binding protein
MIVSGILEEGEFMITLKDVKKVFQSKSGNVTAVDSVDLNINKGEIFGIIGYSGAGKSSLIRLLNGLEKPTSGSIQVAGRQIDKIRGDELRTARHEISILISFGQDLSGKIFRFH